MEIWKKVPGFGKYEVSNLGQVRRISSGHILSPKVGTSGYLTVHLRQDSSKNGNMRMVHRLVGLAFIKNVKKKREINHKDGNKFNNNAANLEWATPQENIRHSLKKGWVSGRNALSDKDVKKIRRLYKTRKYTQNELGKMFNRDQVTISKVICKQTRWWI